MSCVRHVCNILNNFFFIVLINRPSLDVPFFRERTPAAQNHQSYATASHCSVHTNRNSLRCSRSQGSCFGMIFDTETLFPSPFSRLFSTRRKQLSNMIAVNSVSWQVPFFYQLAELDELFLKMLCRHSIMRVKKRMILFLICGMCYRL